MCRSIRTGIVSSEGLVVICDDPRVTNRKLERSRAGVPIDRTTKWGNPFIIGVHGTREEVIEMYEQWLFFNPLLTNSLHELRGRDLVCWCKPAPCHGDVLLRLANG